MLRTLIIDDEEPIGINLLSTRCGIGNYVNQFYRTKDCDGNEVILRAEKSGVIQIGDLLQSINGVDVSQCNLQQAKQMCKSSSRPLIVGFRRCVAEVDLMAILGDSRKMAWMTDHYQRADRMDRVHELRIAQTIHSIMIAVDSVNFNDSSDSARDILIDALLAATLGNNECRSVCQELNLESELSKLATTRSFGDVFNVLCMVYLPLRQRFELIISEFSTTAHWRRMVAYFSCDAPGAANLECLYSCLLSTQARSFLYLFCGQHHWYAPFEEPFR